MRHWLFVVMALLLVAAPLVAVACGEEETDQATDSASPATVATDIVDTAVADGRFGTLVQALQAAGLDAELKKAGPYAVFAPTDAAFEKLPAGTVDELLADPKRELTTLLTFHVVPEELAPADARAGASVETVMGEKLFTITGKDGKLYVNNVEIVDVVETSNGVVYVIDDVLPLPD